MGENARLQSEPRRVDCLECLVNTVNYRHDEHRAEHFFTEHARILRCVGNERGFHLATVTTAAENNIRSLRLRFCDPLFDPDCSGLIDNWTNHSLLVPRRSSRELADLLGKQRHEPLGQRCVHNHALHGDAGLASLVVRERGGAGGCPFKVFTARPILKDHSRRIATQFESDVLARHCSLDCVTNRLGTGERNHRQALILDEIACLIVSDRKHTPRANWQVRLGHDLTEDECRKRRCRRGFDDDWCADRNGWRNFVGDEVEREIERCNPEDRTLREPAH